MTWFPLPKRESDGSRIVSSIMPANDADGNPLQLNLPPILPADVVALAAADQVSQDEPSEQEGTARKPVQSRPLMIYTRPQMLHLQSSPLVKSPPDMPELKHWFGYVAPYVHIRLFDHFYSEHEPSLSKKDSEPTTPNSARERRYLQRRNSYIFFLTMLYPRFRRDADDGGA